jgi:hypothetical protein
MRPELFEPRDSTFPETVDDTFCDMTVTRHASASDAQRMIADFIHAVGQKKNRTTSANGAVPQTVSEQVFWVGEFEESRKPHDVKITIPVYPGGILFLQYLSAICIGRALISCILIRVYSILSRGHL